MPPTGDTYRHRKTFDFSDLDSEYRDVLQVALNDDERPWGTIIAGKVPVVADDLGRFSSLLEGHPDGTVFVVEADVRGNSRHGVVRGNSQARHVVWDPGYYTPNGVIDLERGLFDDPPAARAEFMAVLDTLAV